VAVVFGFWRKGGEDVTRFGGWKGKRDESID